MSFQEDLLIFLYKVNCFGFLSCTVQKAINISAIEHEMQRKTRYYMNYSAQYLVFPDTFHVISRKIDSLCDRVKESDSLLFYCQCGSFTAIIISFAFNLRLFYKGQSNLFIKLPYAFSQFCLKQDCPTYVASLLNYFLTSVPRHNYCISFEKFYPKVFLCWF